MPSEATPGFPWRARDPRVDRSPALQPQVRPRALLATCASGVVCVIGLGGAGCSGAQIEQQQSEVRALKDEVDELKRSQAAARVQFDEFRNRLVVIEDKADTARVQRARTDEGWMPKLPTVVVARTPQDSEPKGGPREARRMETQEEDGDEAPLGAQQAPNGSGGPADDLPPQTEPRPKIDDAAALYTQAKALLDAGQVAPSRAVFEQLLKRHPTHDLADNALYWVGEGFYAQALWLKAAQSFLKVARDHPRGNKVPDAMLKLGKCYQQLGDDKGAGDVLRQLTRLYPGTPAAQLAAEELGRMPARNEP